MLVSVIIPVYNGEKYIVQALNSVINQTFKGEYEIIIVNDASTDLTAEVLNRYDYEDIQLSILTHTKNRGTAYALNTGIKRAKGEFIRWLGADDELLPDALEVMHGRILQMQEQGHDVTNMIFYTNYHIINENGDHLGNHIEPKTPPDLWEIYYGASSTAMIHRNVFEKCGLLDESLRSSEDYEFWLRATMLHGVKLKLIPVFTINYRRHDKQLTESTRGENDPAIREKIRSQLTAS